MRVHDGATVTEVMSPIARRLIRYLVRHQARPLGHQGRLVLTWGSRGVRGTPTDDGWPVLPNEAPPPG